MLQQGFNIKEIMDLTELTKEEIEELKQELKQKKTIVIYEK